MFVIAAGILLAHFLLWLFRIVRWLLGAFIILMGLIIAGIFELIGIIFRLIWKGAKWCFKKMFMVDKN